MNAYELAALIGASSPILRPFAHRAAWLMYRLARPWVDRKAADLACAAVTPDDSEEGRRVAELADVLFPERPAGADLPSIVVHWKAGNTALVLVRGADLLAEHGVEVRAVPRSWLLPLLDAAGNVEDPDLQEMWAQLLASGVEADEHQHPMWVRVLAQMSGEDARAFKEVCAATDREGVSFVNPEPRPLLAVSAERPEDVRLEALGVAALVIRHAGSIAPHEQAFTTREIHPSARLSELGAQFRRAVMSRP